MKVRRVPDSSGAFWEGFLEGLSSATAVITICTESHRPTAKMADEYLCMGGIGADWRNVGQDVNIAISRYRSGHMKNAG